MKIKIWTVAITLALGLAALARGATNDLTGLLQQGLFEEEANRNLDAAIASYQSLATVFDKDRQIAATAIFRLGECYRKLSKTNEAVIQYQRIIKEFSDQQALVNLSRQNLTGLNVQNPSTAQAQNASASNPLPESVTTDEEQTQIRKIQAMIQNSPDLINAAGGGESGIRTPLQRAAESGQLVVAKYLLDHGADVNASSRGNQGEIQTGSPLYLAANSGQKAMAELLLAHGANVNGGGFLNPLYAAVSHGFTGVAEVLIANKADVNARGNENSKRPLHAAVSNDKTNLIQSLIEHGADVNAPDSSSNTPLHVAAREYKLDAAKILVAAKADVDARDKDGNTPLLAAAWRDSDKIVSLLLDAGASVDATNHDLTTPLAIAINRGSTNVMRTLLAHKADPNLNSRPDPNWSIVPPVIVANGRNNPDVMQMLLEAGANPNGDTNLLWGRPIFNTLRDGGAPNLKLLLQHGADPNAKNNEGRTSLFLTTNPEPVRLLIEYKADLNARDPLGDTPIMRANDEDAATNFVKILADAGAKLDLQDTNGNTALHFAVGRIDPESVRILLEHKASPNIQNDAGYTPLDIAKARSFRRASMLAGNSGFAYRSRRVGGTGGIMPLPVSLTPESSSAPAPLRDVEQKIADLLVNAGGLENLPKRDRIEARRSANTVTTLSKDSRGSNRFSLLELIASTYRLLSQNREGEWQRQTEKADSRDQLFSGTLRFPDFKNVIIYRRTNASAKQTAIKVDVDEILKTGDCSRDQWLEWGDIVEIPEADHPVDQTWPGLSSQDATSLIKCVSREVTLKIKGESTTLKLAPELKPVEVDIGDTAYSGSRLTRASFMLRSVLDNSKLIRVSSDLSHVKVTSTDPETKKKMEWVIDCTNNQQSNLWLRDGDIIDVPEK